MNLVSKFGLTTTAALILGCIGVADAEAQQIRTYGSQAEAQYGTQQGTTALPGAPATVSQPQTAPQAPQPKQETDEASGEPDYENSVTVFRRSGDSESSVRETLDFKPEEMYRGVIPGTRDEVEHLEEARKSATSSSNTLTWIGFQPREQSTRVFIQTARAPDYRVSRDGTTVVLTLANTKLSARNFSRSIDTEFFDRNVRGIDSKQVNRTTVEVRIRLAKGEEPRVNATSSYVYVDFSAEKLNSDSTEEDSRASAQPTALDE